MFLLEEGVLDSWTLLIFLNCLSSCLLEFSKILKNKNRSLMFGFHQWAPDGIFPISRIAVRSQWDIPHVRVFNGAPMGIPVFRDPSDIPEGFFALSGTPAGS